MRQPPDPVRGFWYFMKVIYIRDSRSRGYLRIGISDGSEKSEYTVSESEYRDLSSPLIGDEISDLSFLKLCDMRYRGKLYALRILSFGDNNEQTLRKKLISRSISADVAREICEQMVGLGYINEDRQLEKLIENEANVRLFGKKKILLRLLSKGYQRAQIEAAIERAVMSGAVDFEASRKKLIDKKFPSGASPEEIKALLYKSGYACTAADGDYD